MFAWQRPTGHTDLGDPAWFPNNPSNMYDGDSDPPVTYSISSSHGQADPFRVVEFDLGGTYKVDKVTVYAVTNADNGGNERWTEGRMYIWDGSQWVESDSGLRQWTGWGGLTPDFEFGTAPETTKIKLEIRAGVTELCKTKVFDIKVDVEQVERKGSSQISII